MATSARRAPPSHATAPDATSAAEAAAAATESLRAATEAVELADGDVVSSDGVGNFAATLDGIAAAEMGEAATLAAEAIDHVGVAGPQKFIDASIVDVSSSGMEPVMGIGAQDVGAAIPGSIFANASVIGDQMPVSYSGFGADLTPLNMTSGSTSLLPLPPR